MAEKLKTWTVDYSIRYVGGKIEELQCTLDVPNGLNALYERIKDYMAGILEQPDVEDLAVWNIGMIADVDDPADVF